MRRHLTVPTLALAGVALVGAITPSLLGGPALADSTGLTARMVPTERPDIVVPDLVGLNYQEAQVEMAMLGSGSLGLVLLIGSAMTLPSRPVT